MLSKHFIFYHVVPCCSTSIHPSVSDWSALTGLSRLQSVAVFILRQKAVNWGSVLVLWPWRVHFSPPPLLSKSEPSMCRQLRGMGGGVNDLHCCATHSRGVLKPGNSWSQQSVHHFICGRQDEPLRSRRCSVSSVSVAVFVVRLLL